MSISKKNFKLITKKIKLAFRISSFPSPEKGPIVGGSK